MKLNVPIHKNTEFSVELFELISNLLTDLKLETGKWPDRLAFTGSIGVEVFSYLKDLGWDLSKFGASSEVVGANKIIAAYSKPLNEIQEPLITQFDDALNNRTIKSIPGEATIQKILSAYAQPSFKIERTIRPSSEIRLVRLNK